VTTVVDLERISLDYKQRLLAMTWCYDTFGPTSEGRWDLRELRYMKFQNPKDATFFILKWS
jgi:hypothetical protein